MDFREAKKEIEKEFQVHEVIKKLRVCFNVLQETHGEDQFREYIDKYSLFEVKEKRSARTPSMVIDDMIKDANVESEYNGSVVSAKDVSPCDFNPSPDANAKANESK